MRKNNNTARATALALAAAFAVCTGNAWAVVFPDASIPQNSRTDSKRNHGLKRALLLVVHDDDDPYSTSEWNNRVAELRNKEESTREFFATNSGGAYDIYYEDILDIPMQLNSDGTRPSGFAAAAQTYAQTQYGKNLNDYYMFAYDLRDTQKSPNQGWGGFSTSNRIYMQSTSQRVWNHEIGHQVGADHAKRFRTRDTSSYHPYVWDEESNSYVDYDPAQGIALMPYGVTSEQYGNPFDTMGSGSGQFRIREKLEDLGWLTEQQVPRIDGHDGLGPGQYKIYAHDELQAVTNVDGDYGVQDTYAPDVMYGLTYQRIGKVFGPTVGRWGTDIQTIDIEYRSGMNGALVYMNGTLVNMEHDDSWVLDVGSTVEDPEFGLSRFSVEIGSIGQDPVDIDFLSLSPPPPPELPDEWYSISVTDSGADAIGSYIVVEIAVASGATALPGDFNQDGTVDSIDYAVWREGLDDTYTQADFDTWRDNYGATIGGGGQPGAAPEPAGLAATLLALAGLTVRGRRVIVSRLAP